MRLHSTVLITWLALWPCVAVQRRVVGVQSRHKLFAHQDAANPFGSLLTVLGLGEASQSSAATQAQHNTTAGKTRGSSLSGDEAAMEELKATVRAAASAASNNEEGEEGKERKEENKAAEMEAVAQAQGKRSTQHAAAKFEFLTAAKAKSEAQAKNEKAQMVGDTKPTGQAESKILVKHNAKITAQKVLASEDTEVMSPEADAAQSMEMGTDAGNASRSTPDELNLALPSKSRDTSFSAVTQPRRPHRPGRARRNHRDEQDEQDEQGEQDEHAPVAPSAPAASPGSPPTPERAGAVAHNSLGSHAATGIIRKARHSQGPEPSGGEVCDNSMQDCKRSMCRWLKMSSKDTPGRCGLFEAQLRSCTYPLPEVRPRGAPAQPLDCAIELLRRNNVPAQDVGANVAELVACIDNAPPKVNSTCYVALGLLRTEVSDWKEEVALKKSVTVLQGKLKAASDQGRVALNAETKENEAIAELTQVLEEAEPLPGHYLVDEVREARGVLDRLAPIPSVREELIKAAADAKHAFETTSLWRVKQAIVWLGVSVGKASRYGLSGPAAKGKKALQDLQILKQALLDLKDAKFQANVSIGTKSGVPESLNSLNASIHKALNAGLTNGMPSAHSLLHQLQVLKDTVQAAADATVTGIEILAVGGNKGEQSLANAAVALNSSLVQAAALGLSDNSTVSHARDAYDRIVYILGARHALQKAERRGQRVLSRNGSVLSDDSEEAAIDILEPAIAWGTEVGLLNGLDAAEAMGGQLWNVERAKENMTFALATGNVSLETKAGVNYAVATLEAAISGSLGANTSAGVAAAQEQVKQLRAILAAHAALKEGLTMAERAMTSRSGYIEAEHKLNVSVHTAEAVGLDEEAAIAENQLRHLRSFARAEGSLIQALHRTAPARRSPKRVSIEDMQPNVMFHRFGLKVVSLPQVPNGNDDGDRDFDEHIEALQDAIQEGKRKGEVDPRVEALYENALGMKSAHALLSHAIAIGEAAMDSKTNVDASVAELTIALREASEREIVLDVWKGSQLLAELQKIPPALEKIRGAMLAVNVSMRTQTGMDNALTDIMSAIDLNKQLALPRYVPEADRLREALLKIKQAYVQLKAAVMQGQISLQSEAGEEAAIAELAQSIEVAQHVGLRKLVEDAQELHDELQHMDTQHNNLQVAMNPSSNK